MNILIHLLNIHYWYTRTSTYGISVLGNSILCLSNLLISFVFHLEKFIEALMPDAENPKSLTDDFTVFVIASFISGVTILLTMLPTAFMARTIWGLEIEWKAVKWPWFSCNVPTVRRLGPTHKERASRRLDQRTDLRVVAAVRISHPINILYLTGRSFVGLLCPSPILLVLPQLALAHRTHNIRCSD